MHTNNNSGVVAKLARWAGFEAGAGHLSGADYVHPQSGAMIFVHNDFVDVEWHEFGEKFAARWEFSARAEELARLLVRMDRRKPEEPFWVNHPDGTSTPFGGKHFRPHQ